MSVQDDTTRHQSRRGLQKRPSGCKARDLVSCLFQDLREARARGLVGINDIDEGYAIPGTILSNAGNAQHLALVVPDRKEGVSDPAHGPVWTQDPIL